MNAAYLPKDETQRQIRMRAKAEFGRLLRQHRIEPGLLAIKLVQGRIECQHCDLLATVSTLQAVVHAGEKDPDPLKQARADPDRWPCPHCAGTGFDSIEPALRLQAEREILSRIVPTVRAVEVEGGIERRVTFVNMSGQPTARPIEELPELASLVQEDDEL